MDSALSINIQNTNTKLFDTLRKLSSQQSGGGRKYHRDTKDNDKGSYHNIPIQIRRRQSIEEDEEEGIDLLDHNDNDINDEPPSRQTNIMLDNSSSDSIIEVKQPKIVQIEKKSTVKKKMKKQVKSKKKKDKIVQKNSKSKNRKNKKNKHQKSQSSTSVTDGLLAQSFTNQVGNGRHTRAFSSSLDQSGNDQGGVCIVDSNESGIDVLTPNHNLMGGNGKSPIHGLHNSDTLNTLSSMTPTITHSLLMDNNGIQRDTINLYNVGCNIDD